ncbi:MAG: glycosyltransferase family 2 protein [Candidatus Peregrinibacteria bacterium]|nr:glycosyltransferase family 2 protein [Candidatus Peregrinibacteria bacterium]
MQHRRKATFTVPFILALYIPTTLVACFALTKTYVATNEFAFMRLGILLLFMPILIKYLLHLLIAPWYPVIEFFRARKRPKSFLPTVSVLIPAWNEEVGILATVRSVLQTHYPHLEIIVINDGSTDGTHERVTAFIAEWKKGVHTSKASLQYKRVPNGGKARALNAGLAMATGEIIITIDADSAMDPRAIRNMVKHFSDARVASVAGNVAIGKNRKPIGLLQQLEYLYGFFFKRADSLLNAVYIVGGAAGAYRRKLLLALGGFDETIITEDIEMSTRLQDEGYRVRYAADAIVYTEGPADIRALCQQRLRWKFGRLLTFYKYRHLFFSVKRKHNTYLCFLILPIALFAEFLLFFEGALLTIFYTYTVFTNDYLPLLIVILLLTAIVCFQILLDTNTRYHTNLLLLAPGAWILFYLIDIVEYQALIRSLWYLMRREHPIWQRWVRVGVFGQAVKGGKLS